MRYLGIHIHYRKRVEEHIEKQLSSWKGKDILTGGRLTLINLVLSSLPMHIHDVFYFYHP
jgi:hypothetical protein